MSDVLRSSAPRYQALDSMRGLCACMVALFHFQTIGAISLSTLVSRSGYFVDFFFILSGFVISYSYAERIGTGFSVQRFMLLRLGRIYPLHLAMMLLFGATFLILKGLGIAHDHGAPAERLGSFFAILMLIQIFLPHIALNWNGPSWSIAAECWTYLIFAGLYRLGRTRMTMAAMSIAAAGLLYMELVPSDRTYDIALTGMARALIGFSFGYLLYRAAPTRERIVLSGAWATAFEVAAVAAMILALIFLPDGRLAPLYMPLFAVTILVLMAEQGAVSRLLKKKPAMLLGTLSYSIYMIHLYVQRIIETMLELVQRRLHIGLIGPSSWNYPRPRSAVMITGSPLFSDLLSIGMLMAVIGVAALSYHYIEQPARRWSRDRLLGGRGRPTRAAVAAGRTQETLLT